MNLLLLLAGYPIVIISNQIRNDYINAIAYEQNNQDDIARFLTLVLDSTKTSFFSIFTFRLKLYPVNDFNR
jgi:hypothetical protein